MKHISNCSEALHQGGQKHRVRRVPGELPVGMQNLLHSCQPEVREGRKVIVGYL